MGKSLRLLIVEDSEDDTLLLVRQLEKGGFDPFYERVETAPTMESALKNNNWDLILCDYKLPRFDGLQALRLYKESGQDIPFILVSGTIGEETAVAAMKAGAHDYIMKDKLSRLVPVIERELRETLVRRERRQAEDLLKESGRKWQTTFDAINDSVCLLDLQGKILQCNQATARFLNMPLREIIGRHCFELVHKSAEPIEDCPVMRTRKTRRREELLQFLNERWIFVTVDPIFDEAGQLTGAVHIISDVTEKKRSEDQLKNSLESLRRAMNGIIEVIAATVETRDPYTAGHQRRVADLARAIAREMGLPENRIDGIGMAGMVHDLGKISVPAEILSKPTKLTAVEFALIKVHPEVGYAILKDIEFPWPVAQIVFQHHERINGAGYPRGLKGEEILLEAKILAVADVVEAIASHRPYRPAHGMEVALEEISSQKGILYDPEVVEACLKLFKEKDFAWE
jgi:PAS domain S-box-containing protein